MLYKLQPNDIARIREAYKDRHLLYDVLSVACKPFERQTGVIMLSPEEVFVQVAAIIDNVKQKQQDTPVGGIWEELYSDYQRLFPSASKKEICTAVSVIVGCAFALLYSSNLYLYHDLAKQLTAPAYNDFPTAYRVIDAVIDKMPDNDNLVKWYADYIDTDEFLSDELKNYYDLLKQDISTEHTFAFYSSYVSEITIPDIENKLRQAAVQGATDIVKVFNTHTSAFDFTTATDRDIERELRTYYGFSKTYDSLNDAMKKCKCKRQ